MRGANRCPDELFARSRRGPLSAVERRALDAHLGVCDLCRAAQAFATLYDQTPDLPDAEDATLIPRLVDRVVYGHGRASASRRLRPSARALAFAAAAALVVLAGGAAAWVSNRRPLPEARPTAAPLVVASKSARLPAPPSLPAEIASPALPETAVPIAPPRRRAAVADSEPSDGFQTSRDSVAPAPSRAAELFAAANAARHAHDLRLAIARYETLQRRFAGSAEAAVSHVSAGDLLARLGEPAAAVAQFDRYLRAHATGPLAPEALFGRARCLETLGHGAQERETWRALTSRFPGSIYERVARARLDELE